MAENSFNAVERVDEFSHIPSEGGPADDNPPPPGQSRAPSRVPSLSALNETSHIRSGSVGGPNGIEADGSVMESAYSAGYGGGGVSDDEDSGETLELPPGFPRYGEIRFEDAQMRYRPNLPLVLKGLSFTIEAGSSVRSLCSRDTWLRPLLHMHHLNTVHPAVSTGRKAAACSQIPGVADPAELRSSARSGGCCSAGFSHARLCSP